MPRPKPNGSEETSARAESSESARAGGAGRAVPQLNVIEKGKSQYLVGPRRGSAARALGVLPMSASTLGSAISNLQRMGADVVDEIKPTRQLTALSSVNEATTIYVVQMDPDTAQVAVQSAPPNLIVEPNDILTYGMTTLPRTTLKEQAIRAGLPGEFRSSDRISSQDIQFRIVDANNRPIPNTKILLTGEGFPQNGLTDGQGEVTLKLFTVQSGRAKSLFVDPEKDHWTWYAESLSLSTTDINVIRLQSLEEVTASFQGNYRFGWGQRAMGLDLLPDDITGKGAKIGIIDSGADNTHPLLTHIKQGVDFTENAGANTWTTDIIGHGTHTAGVIGAKSTSTISWRGFAPDAEIHALKIFPGGQYSILVKALDHCVAVGADVVNLSLGGETRSEILEQAIAEATNNGVACIIAAGNTGGPVMFPAASPNALAVSAIGNVNSIPDGTWERQTILPQLVASDGIFSPSFTCFGPEINVCAPGVPIVSTVPNNGFDAQAGTSMAAPHVSGLAGLYIAHHPAFQSGARFSARNSQRVVELFRLITSSVTPYNFGPGRTGFGLPTVQGLLREVTASAQRTSSAFDSQEAQRWQAELEQWVRNAITAELYRMHEVPITR